MAVAQIYTAIPNDVITAARWNNEFGNIYNNGTDIAFPLTKAVSLAGFTVTLDAAASATLSASAGIATLTGSLVVTGSQIGGSLSACKIIGGLTYANAAGDPTNDLTIAVGEAESDNATLSSRRLLVLASAITKQSDVAWAVGDTLGGLDTGSVGNSDYYIWLIQRPDTGVVDVLFSLSSTAPTMPANYTLKRLIGWFKRTAGAIVTVVTYEEGGGALHIQWKTPTLDIDLANTLTTSRRTDALKVPLNISTRAHIRCILDDAALVQAILLCPDETDTAPSTVAAPGTTIKTSVAGIPAVVDMYVRTSATGTIAARSNVATVDLYRVVTVGFTMDR